MPCLMIHHELQNLLLRLYRPNFFQQHLFQKISICPNCSKGQLFVLFFPLEPQKSEKARKKILSHLHLQSDVSPSIQIDFVHQIGNQKKSTTK